MTKVKRDRSVLKFSSAAVVLLMLIAAGLILWGLPATHATAARPQISVGSGTGFWHTNGSQIVDATA
jgi:hypothetical protein